MTNITSAYFLLASKEVLNDSQLQYIDMYYNDPNTISISVRLYFE